jgi:bifunctional UDP-N-acetylglucosamine pyrophosphorylase/glucosamine-1-phosphate N-acetyltransferase
MNKSAIILAAGDGTRMKSVLPKVLMPVKDKPMLDWVIESVIESDIDDIAVIIGNNAELLKKHLGKYAQCSTYLQSERKGSGHAAMCAEEFLNKIIEENGDALVLCGDAPFIDSETIRKSYELHKRYDYGSTVITADVENPSGYGRIVRNCDNRSVGNIQIVEHRDCTDEQLSIKEVNSGACWFSVECLIDCLNKLTRGKNGEYCIYEAVGLIKDSGTYKTDNSNIVLGANDLEGLQRLNDIASELD